MSANLDGSDVQLFAGGLSPPAGIDVHENDIYFTEWSGNLYKQSNYPKSSRILIHSDTPHMESVRVYNNPGNYSTMTLSQPSVH